VGLTETILVTHLFASKSPFRLYDFSLSLVRAQPEESACQAIASFKLPCIHLVGAGTYSRWHTPSDCERLIAAALATRCNVIFGDRGKGKSFPSSHDVKSINDEMMLFVRDFSATRQSLLQTSTLPALHTVTISSASAAEALSPVLKLIFDQRLGPTLTLLDAIGCLLFGHLSTTEEYFPNELRTLCANESPGAMSELLLKWTEAAWDLLQDISVVEGMVPKAGE
jgi:hypothetical protein